MTARVLLIAAFLACLPRAPASAVQEPTGALDSAPTGAESEERRWAAEDGGALPFNDDGQVLEFLRTASVVERKTSGKGITQPELLVLEKGGLRVRAIFHDIRVSKPRHRLATGETVLYFQDSYENNVAAYELARIMGITNVPPVVVREVDGRKGSVQLWIENSYDEAQRRKRGAADALPVLVRRRTADMWVFDNLINNIDRNQGNMLYDSVGGFWWIDHTRTFSRADKLFSPDRIRRCSRTLLAALRALERAEVEGRLGDWIDRFEIKSLFKRRDKVVKLVERSIAERGEQRVLFSYGDPDNAVSVSYDEVDDIPASPDEDQ